MGVITLQNYINAGLDKTEMLMTSNESKKHNSINGNRILSRNVDIYIYIYIRFVLKGKNYQIFIGSVLDIIVKSCCRGF